MVNVTHERNGELVPHSWSWFALAAVIDLCEAEGNKITSTGSHTFEHNRKAVDSADGECFEVQAGDTVCMWR